MPQDPASLPVWERLLSEAQRTEWPSCDGQDVLRFLSAILPHVNGVHRNLLAPEPLGAQVASETHELIEGLYLVILDRLVPAADSLKQGWDGDVVKDLEHLKDEAIRALVATDSYAQRRTDGRRLRAINAVARLLTEIAGVTR